MLRVSRLLRGSAALTELCNGVTAEFGGDGRRINGGGCIDWAERVMELAARSDLDMLDLESNFFAANAEDSYEGYPDGCRVTVHVWVRILEM